MTQAGETFDFVMARTAVGAYNDAQDVRIGMMNRIRDIVRKKREGIPFDAVEEEKDQSDFSSEYNDENLPDLIVEMLEEGTITEHEHTYLEKMLNVGQRAQAIENEYSDIMQIARSEPIYSEWLKDVTGIGDITTAKLLHQFGYCEKFPRVSNLWSYCGLTPDKTGRKKGEQLSHSPQAKTLLWNVGLNLIRSQSKYTDEFYYPYKEYQTKKMKQVEDIEYQIVNIKADNGHVIPATFEIGEEVQSLKDSEQAGEDVVRNRGKMLFKGTPPESEGHLDNRARRYLAKKFIKHYWAIARDLKGLDVPDEWVLTHGGHDKETDTFENPFYAKRIVTTG